MDSMTIKPIAYIRTDFSEKFGVPRQSGIVPTLKGRIVFEPDYRDENALRGIETYTHLWLIWGFSENRERDSWEPTVRPPRLGGNTRVGVFATRSPYRPNPLGLTLVKLEKVEKTQDEGSVIIVSGVDMTDMTPIYDIKPYLPYVEAITQASDGLALSKKEGDLAVEFENGTEEILSEEERKTIESVIAQDPRPQYHDEPGRVYRMKFKGYDVGFVIGSGKAVVTEVRTAEKTDRD